MDEVDIERKILGLRKIYPDMTIEEENSLRDQIGHGCVVFFRCTVQPPPGTFQVTQQS